MTSEINRFPDDIDDDELLRFVDGALDDNRRVQVLTWLAARPDVVAQIEADLHQNARLRALKEHLPMRDSRGFAQPLQAALATALGRQRRRRSVARYAAAAAVALVALGGVVGLAYHDRGAAVPPLLAQAGSTVNELYFPFGTPQPLAEATIAGAPAGAQPVSDEPGGESTFGWLAGHLAGFSLTAPELDGIGLQLVRGEALNRAASPAVRLIYADALGSAVVLYAGIARSDADHAFRLVPEGHVSLQWRRGPMIFALVAPIGSPQLSAMVELVSKGVKKQAPAERTEPAVTEPPAGQTGPVQSIAVPVARPVAETPPSAPLAAPGTDGAALIKPEALPGAAKVNEPEAL